jgi:hypothetical protein
MAGASDAVVKDQALPLKPLRADLQVTVSGLVDDVALELGQATAALVKAVAVNLDLGDVERIIITTNYAEDLAAIDRGTRFGRGATATSNEHGAGMAMALPVLREEEWLTVVIVHAGLMLGLISDDEAEQRRSAQTLIHELAHAEDHKLIKTRWPGFLMPHDDVYEMSLIAIVEKARAEYVATRSAASALPETGMDFVTMLADVVYEEPARMKADVDDYQRHENIDLLWSKVQDRIGFFMQASGYALGHWDGLADDNPTAIVMTESLKALSGTTWGGFIPDLHKAIANLAETEESWSGWANYEPTAQVVIAMLNKMKVHPRRMGRNGLYVRIAP